MCVFVSRPMKITLFSRKNVTPQNGLLIFLLEETFRNKDHGTRREDFDEKRYHNNGKLWKSSRILRMNPNFFIFLSFFHYFSSFFLFDHFFHFFIFFIFSSFSFIFFVFVGCSKSDFFFGFHFVTISLDSSYVKNQLFEPSFPFFPTFFSPAFFVFFLAFYFSFFLIFCSFLHFLFF